MYLAITGEEEENVNWLQKHALEALIGVIIAVGAFQATIMLDVSTRMSVVETNISHIDKAVNNVGKEESTLREIVVQNCMQLAKLTGDFNKKC